MTLKESFDCRFIQAWIDANIIHLNMIGAYFFPYVVIRVTFIIQTAGKFSASNEASSEEVRGQSVQ